LSLTACTLPRPGSTPVVYDFGPGALQVMPTTRMAHLPPLELGTPQTSVALGSTAVLYRLAYVDAQQLKPYTLARWSMPPAQLIGARLRDQLGQRRAIVAPGEILPGRGAVLAASAAPGEAAGQPASPTRASPRPLLNLRLEIEEFSQLFDSANSSSGLLRLRATVMQRSTAGDILLAQRSFVAQQPAPSADAGGGVRALSTATDLVIGEIEVWLGQVERQP